MSKSKWRRFKPSAAKQASQDPPKTSLFESKSKPVALVGVIAALIVGLGIAAYATNELLHGHITVTEGNKQTAPVNAVTHDADKRNTSLKSTAVSPQPTSDLVDKYGVAAASPAVAGAIREAEGASRAKSAEWIVGAKAAADRSEALEHGVWKPGANPMQAVMLGLVPPNMDPQQARMLYNALPHLPKSPERMTPERIERMAGGQPDPIDSLPEGLNQEGVRAANQQMFEGHMRQRFGPIYVPPLHRDHNRVVSQSDNQMSLIEPEYSFDSGNGPPQSIREMTDASGNVVSQYRYDPYGRQTKIGGAGPDADFGYQGYYVHQRSGLNLTATRAYNPTLGRFISRDPIEERGGVNLYSYVQNDPINYADPSGLKADSSRNVPCPTHCDNRNGYKVCLPYWCLEETRKGRQPGNAGQTFKTVSFTVNGQRYEAQDDLINGGCYWQKAGQ